MKHFVVKYVFDCNCGNAGVVFVVCSFVILVNQPFDLYLTLDLVMYRVLIIRLKFNILEIWLTTSAVQMMLYNTVLKPVCNSETICMSANCSSVEQKTTAAVSCLFTAPCWYDCTCLYCNFILSFCVHIAWMRNPKALKKEEKKV